MNKSTRDSLRAIGFITSTEAGEILSLPKSTAHKLLQETSSVRRVEAPQGKIRAFMFMKEDVEKLAKQREKEKVEKEAAAEKAANQQLSLPLVDTEILKIITNLLFNLYLHWDLLNDKHEEDFNKLTRLIKAYRD
jgi:hypothetical protein